MDCPSPLLLSSLSFFLSCFYFHLPQPKEYKVYYLDASQDPVVATLFPSPLPSHPPTLTSFVQPQVLKSTVHTNPRRQQQHFILSWIPRIPIIGVGNDYNGINHSPFTRSSRCN